MSEKTETLVRVVDASALGALLFGERRAEDVADRLADAALVAPALLWFEVASICLKKLRTHPESADAIIAAFQLKKRMSIEIVEVDHQDVVQLARRATISTYDASYLWLAMHLSGELVTLDGDLRKAALGETQTASP